MKNEIINNIDNPAILERLYRDNKSKFKNEFQNIYLDHKDQQLFHYWHERLKYEEDKISFGTKKGWWFILSASFFTGLLMNIPNITGINDEKFFTRNCALILLCSLISYFIWKQSIPLKKWLLPTGVVLLAALYINMLPDILNSSSINLAFIHLPLFLWSVLGYTFLGKDVFNNHKRIQFLRYNGDLVVMLSLILFSSILFTAITINLFTLIGMKIENFYLQYIAIWGIATFPMIGTYLVETNPQLINKVSPVIAKIFTPLVFLNLFIYLVAVIYTGKYPTQDRNLLLVFNALLIGVMALILFSIAEASKSSLNKFNFYLLFGLSFLTIIVNCIALSAIVYRISTWGVSPNRLAVLGGNILIFINLLWVSFKLFMAARGKAKIEAVETSIALFLPVYGIWTAIVTFIIPILFHFK
jgi:hypothetical protein